MVNKEYNYFINADWRLEGQVVPFDSINMKSLTIDRNFEKTNMPVIFLELAITKTLLDKLIISKNKSTIRLVVEKVDASTGFRQKYIESEFCYFMTDDVNKNATLDYSGDNKTADNLYVSTMIGLMSLDLINKNKTSINTIYKGATNMDIIVHNLRASKLVIEQVKSKSWGELVLPPLSSLSKLIEYLNYRSVLYDTPYRLFMDFNRTYLLSSIPKSMNLPGENINTIIFDILDSYSHPSKVQGVEEDSKAKVFKIPVDGKEYRMYFDNVADKSYTKITGVSCDGKSKTVDIKSNKNISHSSKVKFIRVPGDNLGLVDNLKYKSEIISSLLSITKSNIDNSIITLDKLYHIRNYKPDRELDGDYLLARKREIYIKTSDHFNCETILDFRKCI